MQQIIQYPLVLREKKERFNLGSRIQILDQLGQELLTSELLTDPKAADDTKVFCDQLVTYANIGQAQAAGLFI